MHVNASKCTHTSRTAQNSFNQKKKCYHKKRLHWQAMLCIQKRTKCKIFLCRAKIKVMIVFITIWISPYGSNAPNVSLPKAYALVHNDILKGEKASNWNQQHRAHSPIPKLIFKIIWVNRKVGKAKQSQSTEHQRRAHLFICRSSRNGHIREISH